MVPRGTGRVKRQCGHCGIEIWTYRSQIGNVKTERKYCSKTCMDAHRSKTVACAECGKEFKCFRCITRKYCSKRCAKTADLGLTRKCIRCGKAYRYIQSQARTSRYCSFSCKVIYEGQQRVKLAHESKNRCGSKTWQHIRRAIIQRDGDRCTRCGGEQDLIVHHKTKWKLTQDNSEANLITLCRTCHLIVEPRQERVGIYG